MTGIYFTSYPQYAAGYAGMKVSPSAAAAGVKKCLIMCYVLLLNPFPVVSSDELFGKGSYQNYQTHYTGVKLTSKPEKMIFKPPASNSIGEVEYDEIIVFQETHILPQFVVYLK